MSKLVYRKKQKMLYCIGGYGSNGQNYELKLNSKNS